MQYVHLEECYNKLFKSPNSFEHHIKDDSVGKVITGYM